jgi:hypothetical protein
MIKIGRILIFLVLLSGLLFAQENGTEEKKEPEYGWKNALVANFSFTQNQFDNWAQGGENSWAWQTDLIAKFINDQEKFNWANSGKLSYGQAKIADDDAKKAADEIKIESVFTYKMGKSTHINPYVAVTGLTQFTRGYEYTDTSRIEISNFMDPGYFTESAGIGYNRGEKFKIRFGVAFKQTITDKFADRYALGETFRSEYGMESVTDFTTHLAENLIYTGKLGLFSNMKSFNEIDVDWDNVFVGKITDILNVTLTIRLFYDRDISLKRQLKQTLAVGFSYDMF